MRRPSPTRVFTALALASAFGCGAAPHGSAAVPGGIGAANDLTSTVMGDGPNFAQASNGRMMTVVSRERGRGAKAGALIELYYPNYAADHLWDSYVGVRTAQGLKWAHDMRLVEQAMVPGTGITTSSFVQSFDDPIVAGVPSSSAKCCLKNFAMLPTRYLLSHRRVQAWRSNISGPKST